MLLTKMDLLNYQYLDKMNNNIGILCYEGRSPRLGCMSVLLSARCCWKLRELEAPSFLWSDLAQVSRSCAEKSVEVSGHGERAKFRRRSLRVEIFGLKCECYPIFTGLVLSCCSRR